MEQLLFIREMMHNFLHWLGFCTAEERWWNGYKYAIEELLEGRQPVECMLDRNEFDQGIEEAIRDYKQNP
jgi:hypothetical protein